MTQSQENQIKFKTYLQEFNCSFFTAIMKVAVIQPFDLIKYRIQSHEHKVKISKLIDNVITKEGYTVFIKGLNVTSFSVFASSLLQFTMYQTYLDYFLTKDSKLATSSLICALSGMLSGFSMGVVLTPLDNIRIKLQSIQNFQSGGKYKYKNSLECMSDVYRTSGVAGFYIALPICLIRESVASFIYFGSFEYLKRKEKVKYKRKNIKIFNSFLYGAFAGGVNWLITLPIDIVKTKIISDTILPEEQKYSGAIDCAKQIYSQSGIKGFYKGFSLVLTRALIVNGVVLTSFDICRSKYINKSS